MEGVLYSLVDAAFSLFMWLIIEPEARPWLYSLWIFSLVLSIGMLWTIFTDRSED